MQHRPSWLISRRTPDWGPLRASSVRRSPPGASGASKPRSARSRASSGPQSAIRAGRHRIPPTGHVCGHGTGHAEAVEVWFDSSRLSYDELLESFWAIHNPTTRNRQGPDIGSQYRSAIFVHDPDQAAQASASLAEHQKQLRKAIVTEIVPAETFWKAEEYHQRYFEKQGRAACALTLGSRPAGL